MKEINEDDTFRVLGGLKWNGKDEPIKKNNKGKSWIYIAAVMAVCAGIALYLYNDNRHYGFDCPLSRKQSEVIEALKENKIKGKAGIEMTVDSCLGVKMKIYKINGLKAEMRDSFPSTDDKDVYLITRSSDYRYDNDEKKIIGDYVLNGEMISKSNWRAGYFAILNGKVEIGVGRYPDMRSFIIDNKGSMFRQFALVSAGIKCTSQYALKGKVSRCAYARTAEGNMYFIETINPETLYGFADALIEYGMIDAIYITGGSQENLFYRDAEGRAQGTYIDDKSHQMVIWKR